jgi:peptide/nickel transport system permease protein
MVGGALITEMIFSYPGLGMAMLTAFNKMIMLLFKAVH